MEVVDAAGRRWTVRRRWLGRFFPQFRGRLVRRDSSDVTSLLDSGLDDAVGLVVGVLVVLVVVLLSFVSVVPVLVFVVELVLLVVVALLGLLGRILFRRAWTIEATCGSLRVERQVVGWRASRETARALARDLRAGRQPSLP